ncbi:hypothetical protein GCM10027563_12690 [Parasphingorhabdus pacifica]
MLLAWDRPAADQPAGNLLAGVRPAAEPVDLAGVPPVEPGRVVPAGRVGGLVAARPAAPVPRAAGWELAGEPAAAGTVPA